MANRFLKRFLHETYYTTALFKRQEAYKRFAYGFLSRGQSQVSRIPEKDVAKAPSSIPKPGRTSDSASSSASSDEDAVPETNYSKWGLELAWLTKALEPALQVCRWALPSVGSTTPPSTRSVSEIIASIQRSKTGIEGWSLSDLTIGLYLIYLRQASLNPFEDITGVCVSSESVVHDLIYHLELVKGCYKDTTYGLAKNTMLRERHILKFVRNSSFLRPGYYIAIDPRKKLVILGIRGTQTVYDLITDIVSSGDEELSFEGYLTHFGTTEAARWFLAHEMGTIRMCLEEYEGFRVRLVGHSLGAATAALLAIMLRKKSPEELGFNPEIVTAVGFAAPPCVSRELAETCSDFVTTVVMQDDIVPRLSATSLERLRNEILQTDWMSVVEKEDWRRIVGLFTNAKQVVSSVQDVARKLAVYAKFGSKESSFGGPIGKEAITAPTLPSTARAAPEKSVFLEKEGAAGGVADELFVPGTVYYLKRDTEPGSSSSSRSGRSVEFFTLWKRQPGEHCQRIVLSSNLISDHKCDSHYLALRDVLKGLPSNTSEAIFRCE